MDTAHRMTDSQGSTATSQVAERRDVSPRAMGWIAACLVALLVGACFAYASLDDDQVLSSRTIVRLLFGASAVRLLDGLPPWH